MAAALPTSFRSLSRPAPADPDIQATLSDFLTYTEHFPAQLTRALYLIEEQRQRAEEKIRIVHDDTIAYSRLPQLKKEDRQDPAELRKRLSYALEEAENASRMNVEEAVRLHENSQREEARLAVVVDKLRAQPLPPSRDATPEQQPLTSPNLKRERRMSIRGDDVRTEKTTRKLHDKAATKLRGRKIMVPGEVLPPPDPNAPAESISSWSSPRVSPPLEEPPAARRTTATPRPRSRTPKPPRSEKTPKPRVPRAPGQPGTNAHSAVAGISTSNALLALTQPPDDTVKGSRWLPWMKLTEWEMARLRKRMKKNAIWVPSQTMVRRELKNLGRGLSGKETARAKAQETGGEFVDEHNEPDPTKILLTGEEAGQINALLGSNQLYIEETGDDADQELINRGMRLNEAKKLKRQRQLEEQALQAQIAREQGLEAPAEIDGKPAIILESKDDKSKKRKRESTPSAGQASNVGVLDTPDPLSKAGPAPKKIRLSAGTSKVPLAPAGASSSSPKASSSTRNRRAATPPAPARIPKITLKAGKAVSEEPPTRRASLRRSSNASLPNGTPVSPNTRNATTTSKSGGRRNRRPQPGVLTNIDAEGAKVSASKRKAAPNRKKGSSGGRASGGAVVPEPILEEPFEFIDPDEPRYCVCGDVSWGTMIACDNEEACDKEWFHLTCVGLEDLPPRRTKWFCPDCRKKLKMGVSSNGIVGSSARR